VKLPPALEAKVLALAGQPAPTRGRKPAVIGNPIAGWAVEFVVCHAPKNEANVGGGLKAKLARKAAAKAAVAAALPPLLPPPPVRVTLTRLGGQQRMDEPDGLGRALKTIQDAVCAALGVDDGDRENVRIRHRQRPAYGAARVLVRVETREG
jgi:hypothetical protein